MLLWHAVRTREEATPLLFAGAIEPFSVHTSPGSLHGNLDKELGLTGYSYFTLGIPYYPGTGRGLAFGFPLRLAVDDPRSWFSWGDIITLVEKIGIDFQDAMLGSVSPDRLASLSGMYAALTFPSGWLPRVASWFTALFYDSVWHAAACQWRLPPSVGETVWGWAGPEVKISRPVPLKDAAVILYESAWWTEEELRKVVHSDSAILKQVPYAAFRHPSTDELHRWNMI